ncbi:hypothetical protein ACLI4Q_19895, partial [Natrialbaceae archaeon A-CW1-1]
MVSLDELFEILSDKRRRYVLYCLHEQDGSITIQELVETINMWEEDPPAQSSAWDKIEHLEVELEHHHLPKTAEADFVQYNPENRTIQVQDPSVEVDALITIASTIPIVDRLGYLFRTPLS